MMLETHTHTVIILWLTAGPAWITMTTEARSLVSVSRAVSWDFTQVRQPFLGENHRLSPSSSALLSGLLFSFTSPHFPTLLPYAFFYSPRSVLPSFPLSSSPPPLRPSPAAFAIHDKGLSGCQRPPRANWLPAKNKGWGKYLKELPPWEEARERFEEREKR